mmetsp:Transcript_11003/g.17020  ORF Transcript_11003/g.17020 Transcript_11003/m.17020 type:complete len:207 (+) Transcript_11003:25-645(+)
MMTATRLFLLLSVVASTASAFMAPGASHRIVTRRSMSDESSESEDPFDTYAIGSRNQELATRDVSVGSGDVIQEGDLIQVEYNGKLMATNKQFDEGNFMLKFGEPYRVMPGWTEGIKGMRIGGTRTLKIPPNLAYGKRGAGDTIPPNSDLEFQITILEKKDGIIDDIMYKTGLGANVKTAGVLFFVGFLAVSPQIDKWIAQQNFSF